jgi:hypothetical protein
MPSPRRTRRPRPVRLVALAGAGALTLGLLVLPGSAVASVAISATSPTTASAPTAAPVGVDGASTDYAGYLAALASKKKIFGTFDTPMIGSCTATDEGVLTRLELSTVDLVSFAGGGVYSWCEDGQAHHQAVFHTSTASLDVLIAEPVLDGDQILVTGAVRRGKIKLTVENLARGWVSQHTFKGFTPDAAAIRFSVILVDGVRVPVPNIDAVAVEAVHVGGQELGSFLPTKVVLEDDAGVALVRPTAITNGTDFFFRHA